MSVAKLRTRHREAGSGNPPMTLCRLSLEDAVWGEERRKAHSFGRRGGEE